MTRGTGLSAPGEGFAEPARQPDRRAMSFSVDGWDPSYGASLEAEGQLEESTAKINPDVELPADRWRPIDPDLAGPLPDAVLFVDGVRRVEAQVWIDADKPRPAVDPVTGEVLAGSLPAGDAPDEPTVALCASYAAGVVCCCAGGAHLVTSAMRRGLFSVAPHASGIPTRSGRYDAHHVTLKGASTPVMRALSLALQNELGNVEVEAAEAARGALGAGRAGGSALARHSGQSDRDLLIVDGPLKGRQHLPRALGYIKSHHKWYLPPELNALVGALAPGQRTPVFHMGTTWKRHSWYLRLPGPQGAPWSGVVRIECPENLPAADVTGLAGLSQRCLGKFASTPYKDSRAPQNLYPIAGLERELRHRLGDPQVLYRALRQAAGH